MFTPGQKSFLSLMILCKQLDHMSAQKQMVTLLKLAPIHSYLAVRCNNIVLVRLTTSRHILGSFCHDRPYFRKLKVSNLSAAHDSSQASFAGVVVPLQMQAVHPEGPNLATDRSSEVHGGQAHVSLWKIDLSEATVCTGCTWGDLITVCDNSDILVSIINPSSDIEMAGSIQTKSTIVTPNPC